jgi:hypothetical protein
VAHRLEGQPRPVPVQQPVLHPLGLPRPAERPRHLLPHRGVIVGVDELQRAPAHHLRFRPPQQPLARRALVDDPTVGLQHGDLVIGVLDQGAEPLLPVRQRLPRPHVLRDVHAVGRHALDLAPRPLQRLVDQGDEALLRRLRAVATEPDRALRGLERLPCPVHPVQDLHEALLDDLRQRLPYRPPQKLPVPYQLQVRGIDSLVDVVRSEEHRQERRRQVEDLRQAVSLRPGERRVRHVRYPAAMHRSTCERGLAPWPVSASAPVSARGARALGGAPVSPPASPRGSRGARWYGRGAAGLVA